MTYVNTYENEADLLTKELPWVRKERVLFEDYCTTSFDHKGVLAN